MNEPVHSNAHSDNASAIVDIFSRLRRRGRALILAAGMTWTISGILLMLVVLVAALGWWGGSLVRIAGWAAVGIGASTVFILTVFLPLRRMNGLNSVAFKIGQLQPDKFSNVLSACQLASSTRLNRFSPVLLDQYFDNAYHTIRAIPPGRVFSVMALLPPIIALVLITATASGISVYLPGVMETGIRTLWQEPHVQVDVVSTVATRAPVLGDLTVTLRYPDYLRRETRKLSSISGGLIAPLGTTVVLEGKPLMEDAVRGYVQLPDGKKVSLTVEDSARVAGKFVVSKAGTFLISLGSETRILTGPERRIDVEKDTPPSIEFIKPTSAIEVEASGELLIEFDAQDDHGLSRIDLVLRTEDQVEVRKTIMQVGDRVNHVRSSYQWSPQSLKMSGSSKIEVELEAFDSDTIRGPKPGRTSPISVQILTRASRHQDVIEEQGRTLDALVDLLAARLKTPFSGKTGKKKEKKERFFALRSQTEDVLGRAARLIYKLKKDPLTSRTVTDVFIQTRGDLSNQLLHESRLYREPMGGSKKRRGVDKVTVRILEAAIIRIDDLILDQQFGTLIDEGSRLDRDRMQLVALIKRYAETGSEATRRAVIDAIEQLEREVRKLQGKLEMVRGKVTDTYVNASASNTIDLIGSLAQLKVLLAAGDLKDATAFAKTLGQDIAKLMAGLESGQLAFRADRFGEGEKFMSDFLDHIMSIESDQLQLRRQTTASLRWYQERLREVMRKQIDPLVKKQTDRLTEIEKHLDKLAKSGSISNPELLSHLKMITEELGFALRQGDLDEARQSANDIAQNIQSKLGLNAPTSLTSMQEIVHNISVELSEAFPKPAHVLSKREKHRIRVQTVKQRRLFAKTKSLRTWIKKQGEDTKFLTFRALSSLNKVANYMENGVTHLENRSSREALEAQTEALNELATLREELRRGNEAAPLESRPVVLRGEVAISKPGDFEVPKEYRDDILEAMRGDLPDNYRDAITRYYETLVR